jgi:hypothetical protein
LIQVAAGLHPKAWCTAGLALYENGRAAKAADDECASATSCEPLSDSGRPPLARADFMIRIDKPHLQNRKMEKITARSILPAAVRTAIS